MGWFLLQGLVEQPLVGSIRVQSFDLQLQRLQPPPPPPPTSSIRDPTNRPLDPQVKMYRPTLRLTLLSPLLSQTTATPLLQATTALPSRASSTVTEPSFWRSMIPKPLRKDNHHRSLPAQKQPPKKDWNPATFFICIFLFIGSMSIQQIALRKDYEAFTRQSDARISLLREVVEKLQSGQDVDVEKVLGTGDSEREKEWDEGLFFIPENR
ncbi:uncharacterized protein PODANS_7_10420 [Podospora anserina S mat+]|uniref:Podospora anserina S mat+ genomic DNA chromosome 7, supercontig 1 n=1 Tax=Podospora anserina (strain S / ATCC MYA-4624 / DSM 980 / FGSC 10383) TaxID=515849 RepID=B2AXF8_PODAN|nr:uncharacterized protein PODANS_7_10420 [Podospora anserina S mat+]CAP69082.1 unnamed protein product [Podospora anserina S mat+]CDP32559.1 Putative protein of unknown function [Podospora anserina S mat+]